MFFHALHLKFGKLCSLCCTLNTNTKNTIMKIHSISSFAFKFIPLKQADKVTLVYYFYRIIIVIISTGHHKHCAQVSWYAKMLIAIRMIYCVTIPSNGFEWKYAILVSVIPALSKSLVEKTPSRLLAHRRVEIRTLARADANSSIRQRLIVYLVHQKNWHVYGWSHPV